MSILDEITRITAAKDLALRILNEKGVATTGDESIDKLAELIAQLNTDKITFDETGQEIELVTKEDLDELIAQLGSGGNSVQSDWAQTDPTAPDYIKNKYDDSELRDKINQIEMAKFPNATIIGTPTINQGQISNFSTTSYLQFPFVVNFQDRPFEINFDITTGTDITNQQNILDSSYGLAFAVRGGRFVIALSTNGTTWDLGEGIGSLPLAINTTYKVRIIWDGTMYKVDISTNGGESYVTDITKTSNKSPYPKQMYIGVGVQNGIVLNTFKGIINMNYSSLAISNKIVWQGMDDVGLATRMAVDMSNIDEAGTAYIKAIAGTVNFDDSYVSKKLTSKQTINSQFFVGDQTTNIANAFTHMRKIEEIKDENGRNVYGFAFAVGANGYPEIQYKTYDNNGNSARNESVLRMTKSGMTFAQNSSSTARVPAETDYSDIVIAKFLSLEKADNKIMLKYKDNNLSVLEDDVGLTADLSNIDEAGINKIKEVAGTYVLSILPKYEGGVE